MARMRTISATIFATLACVADMTAAVISLSACVAFAEPSLPKGPEAWLEFVDGNVRKDGLRLDLEALKDAGISGVHFFHIGGGEKNAPWQGCEDQVFCMGEKWWNFVKFLGEECERLDLGLVVQNCPGWSQSGGPWIDLDHCQRDIECARRDISGGEALRLPDIPEQFRDADSDWRDICVLAFPTPLGLCVRRASRDRGSRGLGPCSGLMPSSRARTSRRC